MTTPRDVACNELVELLTAYLEGALPAGEVAAVEAHLRDCGSAGSTWTSCARRSPRSVRSPHPLCPTRPSPRSSPRSVGDPGSARRRLVDPEGVEQLGRRTVEAFDEQPSAAPHQLGLRAVERVAQRDRGRRRRGHVHDQVLDPGAEQDGQHLQHPGDVLVVDRSVQAEHGVPSPRIVAESRVGASDTVPPDDRTISGPATLPHPPGGQPPGRDPVPVARVSPHARTGLRPSRQQGIDEHRTVQPVSRFW